MIFTVACKWPQQSSSSALCLQMKPLYGRAFDILHTHSGVVQGTSWAFEFVRARGPLPSEWSELAVCPKGSMSPSGAEHKRPSAIASTPPPQQCGLMYLSDLLSSVINLTPFNTWNAHITDAVQQTAHSNCTQKCCRCALIWLCSRPSLLLFFFFVALKSGSWDELKLILLQTATSTTAAAKHYTSNLALSLVNWSAPIGLSSIICLHIQQGGGCFYEVRSGTIHYWRAVIVPG